MIEYHFNEEEYRNDGLMFSREIHEDVNIFFHGTSGQYHEEICKEGLVGPGEGLVSKERVQRVVDFYSEIAWDGEGPISALTGFTLPGDYKDREKKLENVLKKLNLMSNKVVKMNNDINSLNLEKNQLLREKEESKKNFDNLLQQHEELKSQLDKVNNDVSSKFGDKKEFSRKIDELNQETETLIDEIEKWQT